MAAKSESQSAAMATPSQESPGGGAYSLVGPKGEDVLDQVGPPEERLLRIRALLAQWMRMENLVVLLASGCSAGDRVGGKTLAPLEEAVLEVLLARYGPDKSEDSISRQVVEARNSERRRDGAQSFEDWLTHLSNTRHLLELANSPIAGIEWKGTSDDKEVWIDAKSAQRLLDDIERSICGFCALRQPPIEDGATGHHAFFAKLIARDPGLGRGHIFTLNYDTLIEQALDQLGILYFDGFSGRTDAKFDPSVYGLDVYYPGEITAGRVRRYDKFVHLYKLHGSIHWYQASDGLVRAVHPQIDKYESWHKAKDNAERAKLLDTLGPMDRRVAIMPTANKFVQTLDLPFSHLFRAFHQRLNAPQTFFIVAGYGFSDEHVNQIIDSAMTNPSLIMLVVDPRPTERTRAMLKRYQDIGERVFLLSSKTADGKLPATFDDFGVNLLPQVQWLDDFVKLRRYEKTVGQAFDGTAPTGTDPGSGSSL
jgi:hypothetical protein